VFTKVGASPIFPEEAAPPEFGSLLRAAARVDVRVATVIGGSSYSEYF
jgi:hypothetical protein